MVPKVDKITPAADAEDRTSTLGKENEKSTMMAEMTVRMSWTHQVAQPIRHKARAAAAYAATDLGGGEDGLS